MSEREQAQSEKLEAEREVKRNLEKIKTNILKKPSSEKTKPLEIKHDVDSWFYKNKSRRIFLTKDQKIILERKNSKPNIIDLKSIRKQHE